MKNLKYVLILFCALCSSMALANKQATLSYPPNCKPVAFHFEGKQVVLKGPVAPTKQIVYLFNNSGTASYFLNQATGKEGSASAGWTSKIDPGQWSAIVVARNNFKWACQDLVPGKTNEITCKSVLHVCQFQGKPNLLNSGDYWLSENKSLPDTIKALK